jgi:diguanylate cyclase (GGDEF)-like protein
MSMSLADSTERTERLPRASAPAVVPAPPLPPPRRTLVREVLMTQLAFAAVVGLIALVCVWSASNWVVRDNLNRWAARWIGEMESLGSGLYLDRGDDRFLALDNYIARFPEILYVRYYDDAGRVIYLEGAEQPRFAQLADSELAQLRNVAQKPVAYNIDQSLQPMVRISQAVVTQSIASADLFAAETLDDVSTKASVVGFVELGLDYSRYDQDLLGSILIGSAFVAVAFLLLLLAGRVMLRRAVQPLADMQGPLRRMAEGDLDIQVPTSQHQEIAAITRALETAATSIRERDQHLRRIANVDKLTGLPSRHHFMEMLADRLEKPVGSAAGALFFVDLDQFKYVNDTFGHHVGDAMLAQTAERLRSGVRKDDLIARFGGDEFVMFVAEVGDDRAEAIANKLIFDLREFPLSYGDQSFNVNCSIGVAMVPQPNGYTPDELVSQADFACRQAKAQGRNRISVFKPDETELESIKQDVGWQQKLVVALKNDSFVLHYQPIMSVATGETQHYEVLVRMDDEGELHYPNAFLSAASRFGMMQEIDRWVIAKALKELAIFRRTTPNLRFCINVAGGAFIDGGLASYVMQELGRNGLPASALILEITEQVAIGSFSDAVPQIRELIDLGCEFAVDDFGTGYSSLSYLKRLPVQYIKIDGVFIRRLTESRVDQTIVRAIADIARIMGKLTVAEFVGDEKTLALIREIGIDFAQGYFIGKPGSTLNSPGLTSQQVVPLNQARKKNIDRH